MIEWFGMMCLIALNFYGWYRIITQRDNAVADLRMLKAEIPGIEAKARADAIKKSHNVIRGKVTEEMVSLIPGLPYTGSDMKFFGSPLDYIVLDGMSEVRDGEIDEIRSIIFVDVKTGKAGLSKVENAIKRCVNEGRVGWETWKISDTGIDIQTK